MARLREQLEPLIHQPPDGLGPVATPRHNVRNRHLGQ